MHAPADLSKIYWNVQISWLSALFKELPAQNSSPIGGLVRIISCNSSQTFGQYCAPIQLFHRHEGNFPNAFHRVTRCRAWRTGPAPRRPPPRWSECRGPAAPLCPQGRGVLTTAPLGSRRTAPARGRREGGRNTGLSPSTWGRRAWGAARLPFLGGAVPSEFSARGKGGDERPWSWRLKLASLRSKSPILQPGLMAKITGGPDGDDGVLPHGEETPLASRCQRRGLGLWCRVPRRLYPLPAPDWASPLSASSWDLRAGVGVTAASLLPSGCRVSEAPRGGHATPASSPGRPQAARLPGAGPSVLRRPIAVCLAASPHPGL